MILYSKTHNSIYIYKYLPFSTATSGRRTASGVDATSGIIATSWGNVTSFVRAVSGVDVNVSSLVGPNCRCNSYSLGKCNFRCEGCVWCRCNFRCYGCSWFRFVSSFSWLLISFILLCLESTEHG